MRSVAPAPLVAAALATAALGAVLIAGCSSSSGGSGSVPRMHDVWTFDGGELRLDPPPASLAPHQSLDAAMASYRASDAYSAYDARHHHVTAQFAVLGGHGQVPGVGRAGTPVWVIAYRGVPAAPGGGVNPGHPSDAEVLITDDIFLESDVTGDVLVELLDKPKITRSTSPLQVE